MAYELKLPDLGEGLTEGEIARWLVTEGQEVAEDDPLVEIQTDKTTVEIPSPAAGIVSRILAAEGDVVPVGSVIVVISGGNEQPVGPGTAVADGAGAGDRAAVAAPALPVPAGRLQATPLVRRVAQELGVAIESITGSGPGGRITEDDVRAAAGGAAATSTAAEGRRVPVRGVRRLIAEHMARAHAEVPPVTWVEECDFSRVDLAKLVATAIHACAAALQEHPALNARWEVDSILLLDRYDLGFAVHTDQGLVVPVVRDCAGRSIDELDSDVRRLAEGARAGTLDRAELRGSTFSVTSAGKLGGLLTTPIVNHPEVAILSIGRIGDRPVARDGEIVVRPVGTLALTFDHRAVDGAEAAAFGLDVIRRLESP
jgi:pyruvate dehydrogenase E2 component (dihydrolipoamide acetyltransferase)